MAIAYVFAVEVNLQLQKFQFRSEGFSYKTQWILFGFLGLVTVGVAVAVVFLMRGKRQKDEFNRIREATRIKVLLSEFSLGDKERELLETFTESQSPGRYIPLLESKSAFEDTLRDFRSRNPEHPALKHAAKLRQRLGYGFKNVRNPFKDTRMLPVGTRLQCKIPRVTRDVVYLTNIVAVNEDNFIVRPPTSKGRPLTLKGVPNLTFKATRDDDAEYEFICTLVGQMRNEMKTLAVEHTTEIQKLMFRNAPRLGVELDTRFFVVKKEIAAARGHSKFKAGESQYAFQGLLKDLSIGGCLLVTPKAGSNPQVGDVLIFKLPIAQINEELVSEVMRLTDLPGNYLQVHLRFSGMKEINRLKMNKFLESLEVEETEKEADGQPETPTGPATAPAP